MQHRQNLAKLEQAWLTKEQTYKQDILNLQNSTDAKIIEGLEKDLQKKQQTINDLVNTLGPFFHRRFLVSSLITRTRIF